MALTQADKQKILTDFTEWSGGFTPDECEWQQLKTYAELASNRYFAANDVLDYLATYSGVEQ